MKDQIWTNIDMFKAAIYGSIFGLLVGLAVGYELGFKPVVTAIKPLVG
jgi:hypothetical protein